ncbi:hypothetical protein ONE63_005529 [Megalurothrips usitatus]|uniref:General transcription factor IIH subunit 4 n=1 Tax=Megalurothrips usitatus TaxID=439358 RepID=A0AAV7XYB2_9NEOP|nr:hypothetical protein ONE63_005529 [Megalurothrips usitatus]
MADAGKISKQPQSKTFQCKNLHDYLKTLPASTLDKLYNHPTTCLAVYRELPEIGRHYVIRILFVEQPVPQAVVASWLAQEHSKEHNEVIKVLSELRVWQEAAIPGGLPGWILNPIFKKNCRMALLGGGRANCIQSQLDADSKPRDIPFLDQYATERWECVLHYMVGSQQQEGISADAVRLLLHAKLMKRDEEDNSPIITREGFQFLLMDTAQQVWHFILQYLHYTVQEHNLDLVECLTFLFQLSFSTLGKDYSTQGMSEAMLKFLQHLREFGLVYQRKRKGGRFYPTRLALNIAAGQTSAPGDIERVGYIVVETNYRVYAYTDSNLQVALVALFCEMMYRFPNLAVGILTRDSIRQALRSGITAEQMINFLRLHAHPRMVAQGPPTLPPTVVDQIKLWENERDRFNFSEGVLYSQFLSQQDFQVLRDHAQGLGVLIWQNERQRTMVVTKGGHDDVKKFWKRYNRGND